MPIAKSKKGLSNDTRNYTVIKRKKPKARAELLVQFLRWTTSFGQLRPNCGTDLKIVGERAS